MLRKVLKHDLNAVWRPWVILSISALLLSVVGGLSLRSLITYDNSSGFFAYWMPFAAMTLGISVMGIIAYNVAELIIVAVKFYQSFFTDVGYLTFTLPVKRHTLFNSKLLTNFIISFSSTVVTVLAIIIMLLITPANVDGSGILLATAWEYFVLIFVDLFAIPEGWFAAYFIVAILIAIAYYIVFANLIIYMCITVASTLVKKAKLLLAFGIYYAVNSVMSIIGYFASWLANIIISCLIDGFPGASAHLIMTITLLMLLIVLMAIIVLSVTLYRFSLSRIEKNLNLA